MSVSLTLNQVTAIVTPTPPATAPIYQVANAITVADGIDAAVFVFKTINQTFDHYAFAADMEQWPNTYDAANTAGLPFYRQSAVTRNWPSIDQMQADLAITKSRLQALCNDMVLVQAGIVINETTIITASE